MYVYIYVDMWHSNDVWHDKTIVLISNNKRITDVVSRHHHPNVLLGASCLACAQPNVS
jgi:hypothetical protein